MSDPVLLFKEDLESSRESLTAGGSRGDFMEALGEAVYAHTEAGKLDEIIAAYLRLQDVMTENVDNLEESADEAIEEAADDFNESVSRTLSL